MNDSIKFSDLKWGFPTQTLNVQDSGVVQQGFQSFKDVIPSIAREAIQNSLDASQSSTTKVEVRFAFKMIDISSDRTFDNLLSSAETHIRLCKEKYESEKEYHKASDFKKMLSTIDRFRKIGVLPYLEISDCNTIGMYYDREKPDFGRMSSFMHKDGDNNGTNNGNSRGGGFNGIGKMAYFALSPLKMVMASTHAVKSSSDDSATAESFFSGTIKLVSHSCPEDPTIKFQYAGYFPPIPSDIAYLPLTDLDSVTGFPFRFTRKRNNSSDPQMGTSFFIIGCEPTSGLGDKQKLLFESITRKSTYEQEFHKYANSIYSEQFLPAILRNYFAAIRKGLLSVELGNTSADKNGRLISESTRIDNSYCLQKLMSHVFNDNNLRGANIQKTLNPRPFLEALEQTVEDEHTSQKEVKEGKFARHFELDLDNLKELKELAPDKTWGKIRLHLNVNPDFSNNMILCMRAPLMTVCKYKVDHTGGRYAGLLICDEEGNYANQLLRASESATHSTWDSKDASLPGHGESSEVAQALLDTIKDWVESKLEELFPRTTKSDVYVGMRNILAFYDPQDPTQRHQDLNNACDALGDETTTLTIKKSRKKTTDGTKLSKVSKETVENDQDGRSRIGGGSNTSHGGNQPGVSNPTNNVKASDDGKEMKTATKVPLKVRCFINSGSEKDVISYTVVVSGASEDYERIDMQIFAKGENAREPLKIQSVIASEGSNAKKKNDEIISFSIDKGKSVRFDVVFKLSNMQYSLQAVSTIEASDEKITDNNNS